jgi:hypothetical protein
MRIMDRGRFFKRKENEETVEDGICLRISFDDLIGV